MIVVAIAIASGWYAREGRHGSPILAEHPEFNVLSRSELA